ncbi:protein RALF-like 24 [Abeliophyllum distichum]|uniref:Protein RALF-like 24 n=1 Tax=Abeliophyllum distichum TaxID=126358 RepID=A0ABD1SUW1_9LAMI
MKLCNGMSILEVNSLKTNDLDAMVKNVCVGNINDCSETAVEEKIDFKSNMRVLVFQKRVCLILKVEVLRSLQGVRVEISCFKSWVLTLAAAARGERNGLVNFNFAISD